MKKYRIEILLNGVRGGKAVLAKYLNTKAQNINSVFKTLNATWNTQVNYTDAFNSMNNTNYDKNYLFEKID